MNFRRLTCLTIAACSVLSLYPQENSLYLAPPSVPHAGTLLTDPLVLTNAAVVSNGRDFLIAWSENRASTNYLSAARVSGAGALIDVYPMNLAASLRGAVLLTSLDRDFLFSFENSPALDGQPSSYSRKLLRLSSSGSLIDYPGVELYTSSLSVTDLRLVGGPGTALLLRGPGFNSPAAYRIIFGENNLGPEFPLSTPQPASISILGVAASPHGFLIAWRTGSDTRVSRISPEGELLDPNGISLPFQSPSSIAGNDDSWLIVGSFSYIRLSADGASRTSGAVSLPPPPFLLSGVGDSWEAASVSQNRLFVHEFSPSLTLLRKTVTPGVSNNLARASIARNAQGDYLIAWSPRDRTLKQDLLYTVKPRNAELTPIQSISVRQIEPRSSLSRSSSEFAFVSLEFQSPSSVSFQFQRLDLEGRPLLVSPVHLQGFTNQNLNYWTNFGLAAGSVDETHLVVIGSPGRLNGYLIGPDNELPVFATFETGENTQNPATSYGFGALIHIARSQNDFLLSWGRYFEHAIYQGANVMRVSQSGQVLGQKSFIYPLVSWADLNGTPLAFYQKGFGPSAASVTIGTTDLYLTSDLVSLVSWSGLQPKLISNPLGAFATWELVTNNIKTLRASYFTQTPTTRPPSLEIFRFNYPAEYSLAASEHGYLIYGSEQPSVSLGNLPPGRTFAFYYEVASGKILSNIVESVGQFASAISIAGGESDFLATYTSSYDDLQACTQWIRPIQSNLFFTTPKASRGRLTTSFNASLDRTYQIDASSDLINWRPVAEVTGSGSYNLSVETTAGPNFFRAIPKLE